MKYAINLGHPLGIKLKIHWTFFLILVWVGYITFGQGGGYEEFLNTTFFVLLVFACVIAHEFGHALAARRYGIKTRQIVLLPIGGVAQLERFPRKPSREFFVAIAGPLVNVAIGILLFIGIFIIRGEFPTVPRGFEEASLVMKLIYVNFVLFVFNLIPAFPMDGGRILRAFLGVKMDYVRATDIAAKVGQVFAIIFAVLGLFYNPFLILIALFIYVGAGGEANMIKTREFMRGYKVRDALLSRYKTLSSGLKLEDAVRELIAGSDKDFLIEDNGEIKGILTRDILVHALAEKGKHVLIKDVMKTDFSSVDIEDKLEKAIFIMKKEDLPLLPVKENGVIAGAISLDNISELFLIRDPDESPSKKEILNSR